MHRAVHQTALQRGVGPGMAQRGAAWLTRLRIALKATEGAAQMRKLAHARTHHVLLLKVVGCPVVRKNSGLNRTGDGLICS